MADPKPSPPLTSAGRLQVRLAAAACLLPLLLQLPPTLGIGIAAMAVLVLAASWRKPLPGGVRIALLLGGMVAVVFNLPGVGRDTASALLALMIAIKPAETVSLRDGRSLVGFALFAPFATFLLDQAPTSLLLSLTAVMLALLALQRLAADESGIEDARPSGLPTFASAASVLRLFSLGLPLALAVFWLFPRLPTPLWGLPQRTAGTPGLSDSMTPGGMSEMLLDDSPAARVQFFGPPPKPEQMYWRGPVLWDFDGRSWKPARTLEAFPPAPMQPSEAGWRYRLELEPTEDRLLIALDVPTQLPQGAHMGLDRAPMADQAQYNLSRWMMESAPARAFEPQLSPWLRRHALALPPGFNPRTLALGKQWRQDAGRDPNGVADLAIAERAMAMIRRDFAYTLNVPLPGHDEVDDFLFDRKQGYCEHFSSAFVVLMRAAGIPARVVTGYAGAYRNPTGDYWLIRRSDAHAWAEIWLPHRGWVRFDPTAAVAPERIYDTIADRQPGRFGAFVDLAPIFNASDWLRRGWNDMLLGFNAQRQRNLLDALGLHGGTRSLILLFAFATLLAMSWMAWVTARGERERDPLLRAWHALERRYRKLERGRAPHEPALAWAMRITASRDDRATAQGDDALVTLARRLERARYAPGIDDAERQRLIADLRRHRP